MPDNRDVRTTTATLAATAATLITGGCGTSATSHTRPPPARASLRLSSDYAAGAAIPRAHTCDGHDLSPPLRVAGLPAATRELVIVMTDHDAPGGDFIHWGLAHISPQRHPAGSTFLPAGSSPPGAVPGLNSFGSLGYRGPCPPRGSAAHHYEITAYALAQPSELGMGFSPNGLRLNHVLAIGSLTGVYARRGQLR
jgi:Raf kinase inhibitor-like YbhB/YbcL family protein